MGGGQFEATFLFPFPSLGERENSCNKLCREKHKSGAVLYPLFSLKHFVFFMKLTIG
jgi:hypothetical protein